LIVLRFQLVLPYHQALSNEFREWYLKNFTSDRLIHCHWSAGQYTGNFLDYHAVTVQFGDVAKTIVNTDVMTDLDAHTDGRNANSIGLAIACAYNAGTEDLGNYPPTPAQIKEHLNFVTNVCCNHRIPFGNIGTHQERADMLDYQAVGLRVYDMNNLGAPPYGPIYGGKGRMNGYNSDIFNRAEDVCCRWDLWIDIDPKTLKVYPKSKSPEGCMNYADWFRGEVAMRVQERTRSYWAHNLSTKSELLTTVQSTNEVR